MQKTQDHFRNSFLGPIYFEFLYIIQHDRNLHFGPILTKFYKDLPFVKPFFILFFL